MGAPVVLSSGRPCTHGEECAVRRYVLADTLPKRPVARRPAELGSGVLDRDDTSERRFDLIVGGHRVRNLDAAAGYELSHQPGRLACRDERGAGRRVEDLVGVIPAVDHPDDELGDVDDMGVVAWQTTA